MKKFTELSTDSQLVFTFIPLATVIFVTSLLVYQNQQSKRVEQLESQIAALKNRVPAEEEAAPAPAADEAPVQEEVAPAPAENENTGNQQPQEAAGISNEIDTQIERNKKETADLEARLQSLQQSQQSITDQANVQRKQQAAMTDEQKLEMDRQITNLAQALHDLDMKIQNTNEQANTTPPEIPLAELRNQRAALQGQMDQMVFQKQQATVGYRENEAQTLQQANTEKERIRREQDEITRRISELKADMASLQKKKADQGRTLQAQ